MRRVYEHCMPAARKEGLIVKRLVDEVLVYDLRNNKAHCLNQTASFIWDRCDGETVVSKIASAVAEQFQVPVDEQFVWLGLSELSRVRLLTLNPKREESETRVTRRQLMRRLGTVAALVALPAVASIVAPTAVSAASCATLLQSCASMPCCPGLGLGCVLGTCLSLGG